MHQFQFDAQNIYSRFFCECEDLLRFPVAAERDLSIGIPWMSPNMNLIPVSWNAVGSALLKL